MKNLLVLYIGNHNVLELQGLQDALTPQQYENNATVSVALKDSAGQAVAGQTWPATMSYVESSDGVYRATLDADLVLTHGVNYTAEINVTTAGGVIGKWEAIVTAKTRRS